ncbi:MAG: KaiB domain [Bacteriophage sp.]|nr:MAG: KaiB domain protein [Bacteriophage sp.]UVM91529.1 MAG: KaiB domain protein [Bacteriophage sp.]UVN01776.1 MAG: KaiB domain protein [Bacteriophage sp.]UVX34556.1 MAG: KaiB domain [Bacteriophage sp.]UVX36016.1 MAG: KaiB domain [Bacteriophage sp.]
MIKIYTKNNCMPCKMTKNWFKDKEHTFTEVNVDDSLEALNELLTMNLKTLPVVFLDGEFVSMGFAPNKWEEFK